MSIDGDQKALILIVDDIEENLELLRLFLERAGYRTVAARDGVEALEAVAQHPVDLILLDVMMPRMDGFEACRRLKEAEDTRLIPIVMVTALNELSDKVRALDLGVDDFLSKPFNRVELLARVRSLLRVKRLTEELDSAERVIFSLAAAIDARDAYTHGHMERVSNFATRLAKRLELPKAMVKRVERAGIMHDIGKIGVRDDVLKKEGKLTEEEFAHIQIHPHVAERIVSPLRSMKEIVPIIKAHHERFDGRGYPDGLAGEAIPVEARILSIADAYDAMTSTRPYRKALTQERAFQILRGGAGIQWDPSYIEIFIRMIQEEEPETPSGEYHIEPLRPAA